MKLIKWNIDRCTLNIASKYPLDLNYKKPCQQFCGFKFNQQNWKKRIRKGIDRFPDDLEVSSPWNIIQAFQKGQNLQAIALVVSWGKMWRTSRYIYGDNSLEEINNSLNKATDSINKSVSIANAWSILRENLKWSNVTISKTLHFLCRANGYIFNPPVPIDNAVINEKVWPIFIKAIPTIEHPLPWDDEEHNYDSYSRYMTVIISLANKKEWTTTQIEATIFSKYR